MKAISKQHSKSKWIDTKLSRHYVSEMAAAYSKMMLHSQCTISVAEVVHRNIISTQDSNIEDKNTAISENILCIANSIDEINKSYRATINAIQLKWASNDRV